jgi:hypothetical protein
MAKMTKKQIVNAVKKINGFSGYLDLDRFKTDIKAVKGGFETTLSPAGVRGTLEGIANSSFSILVPEFGWCTCYPHTNPLG